MARKKRTAPKASAAPQPSTVLHLDGKDFQLVFTFAALRGAKMALRGRGIQINLLYSFSMGEIDVDTLPELFFAALRTYHPEIDFDAAQALITPRTCPLVVDAVAKAYEESMRDPEGSTPQADPPAEPESQTTRRSGSDSSPSRS